MSAAIRASNISKVYRVGARQFGYRTLRESLVDACAAPWRRLRRVCAVRKPQTDDGRRLQGEQFWALKDVNFEIRRGEVVGIIGRNGAGKSTLLKVLSRVTEPTSGEIAVRGRVGSLLEVGTGFHPELTGRENIYMNGSILGMSRREIARKFDEIVDFSGVEDFLDTQVKRYSSGMYVRLAFAVAAHLEPEIFIVDEVLAVGDAEFQKKCLGKMQDVASHGRTVLFVSHNLASVSRMCTNALILNDGQVVFKGSADEAISRYMSKYRTAEVSWDPDRAPGDDVLRLRAVRVCDHQGKVADRVDLSQKATVQVEFDVLADGHVLVPNLHFFTADGNCAFITHDCDPEWHNRPRPKGRYISSVAIPPDLLNAGVMHVQAVITTYHPFIIHCDVRDAVQFEVGEDFVDEAKRGGYLGTIPGVVRPLLEWQTSRTSL